VLGIVVVLLVIGSFRRDGAEPEPSPAVAVAASSFLHCTDCHGDFDAVFKAGSLPNLLFTHEKHFGLGVSDCAACHSANTHEKDKINRPEMVTCYTCHGLGSEARAPGRCGLCHPPGMDPEPESHRASNWMPELHRAAAVADPFECTTCHEADFCDSCHQTQIPHPAGWEGEPHGQAFYVDPGLCESCHLRGQTQGRDECDACHHPGGPPESTWVDAHADFVKQSGATTCWQCHASQTCETCHAKGTENFTNEDFGADEALRNGTSSGTTPSA